MAEIQLQVKTILNVVERLAGFVYADVQLLGGNTSQSIKVRIVPHEGIPARCGECQRPSPGYDRRNERRWLFVPLWGVPVWFVYAPRRVECPEHGVRVEYIPWPDGKGPVTTAKMGFLARWARGG